MECAQFRMYKKWMCRKWNVLIEKFYICPIVWSIGGGTDQKFHSEYESQTKYHSSPYPKGEIGCHRHPCKWDEKIHIHMSHSVEHRRRRECVIRELLIADSDRRLRLSSSIQEYSQSKESYYIPTYISRYYSVLPISDHVLRKRGKRLIHTWVHSSKQVHI